MELYLSHSWNMEYPCKKYGWHWHWLWIVLIKFTRRHRDWRHNVRFMSLGKMHRLDLSGNLMFMGFTEVRFNAKEVLITRNQCKNGRCSRHILIATVEQQFEASQGWIVSAENDTDAAAFPPFIGEVRIVCIFWVKVKSATHAMNRWRGNPRRAVVWVAVIRLSIEFVPFNIVVTTQTNFSHYLRNSQIERA